MKSNVAAIASVRVAELDFLSFDLLTKFRKQNYTKRPRSYGRFQSEAGWAMDTYIRTSPPHDRWT